MVIFVNMLVGKNIKSSILVPIWVLAGLLFYFFVTTSAPTQNQVSLVTKDQTKVQASQAPSVPLTLTASEPTESAGILHESENLLLPLVVLLVALLFPVHLLLKKSYYCCPTYKIFNFYRILPNAP